MAKPMIEELRETQRRLYEGGGAERVAKQHAAGKMTARERLAELYDQDTFQETHPFLKHRCTAFGMQNKELPGEGVVTGYGLVMVGPCMRRARTSPWEAALSARRRHARSTSCRTTRSRPAIRSSS
jgi:acetyl-CoA carboxylase carboxyltransferase component